MTAVFRRRLDPPATSPHPLHAPDADLAGDQLLRRSLDRGAARRWARRRRRCSASPLTQDFEGDQFTFFKSPLDDLEALYGVRVQELAIYDRLERHVADAGRARPACAWSRSTLLPARHRTALTYRTRARQDDDRHQPRSIAAAARLDYFHNAGYFQLSRARTSTGSSAHPASRPALPALRRVREVAGVPCPPRPRRGGRAAHPAARHLARAARRQSRRGPSRRVFAATGRGAGRAPVRLLPQLRLQHAAPARCEFRAARRATSPGSDGGRRIRRPPQAARRASPRRPRRSSSSSPGPSHAEDASSALAPPSTPGAEA